MPKGVRSPVASSIGARPSPRSTGHYFYGDWCGEWVRSFRFEGGEVTDHQTRFEEVGQINSFGVDADGELYLLTYEGEVKQLVARR